MSLTDDVLQLLEFHDATARQKDIQELGRRLRKFFDMIDPTQAVDAVKDIQELMNFLTDGILILNREALKAGNKEAVAKYQAAKKILETCWDGLYKLGS